MVVVHGDTGYVTPCIVTFRGEHGSDLVPWVRLSLESSCTCNRPIAERITLISTLSQYPSPESDSELMHASALGYANVPIVNLRHLTCVTRPDRRRQKV